MRSTLPINKLRAQTYDGAANMSGKYNACQAYIKLANTNALHFHYATHCANLAAAATAESHALIRDALSNVNELDVLYHRSDK